MTKTEKAQYKILLGVITCQASLVYMIFTGTMIAWAIAFFVYFLMFGLGVSLLNHRILSHKSVVVTSAITNHILLFFSTVMMQGSTLAWVGMHREHHAYSDTPKDPHSPSNVGFWASYWLSMMHTPNIRFVKDLLRDGRIQQYHTHYWKINFAYSAVLLLLFGPYGVIIGHLVPAAMTWHGVSIVNAVSHVDATFPTIIGYKNFETGDNSKNIPIAGYLTFGEGWHNNHHNDPSSVSFSTTWWEFDLIGIIGKLINKANNKMNS